MLNRYSIEDALLDVVSGLKRWRLIVSLGWRDTVSTYRSSYIGPIWLFFQTVLWVLFINIVFGQSLGRGIENYLVYISIGLVVFQTLSFVLVDGSRTFIKEANLIKNIPLPVSVYVFRVGMAGVFKLLFEGPTIIAALLITGLWPVVSGYLSALLGLVIALWVSLGAAFILSALSTRYKDLIPLISFVMRVAFFATPIFWYGEFAKGARSILVDWNPLSYLIQIVRDPLMGQLVPGSTWIICILMGVFCWTIGLLLFAWIRPKLAILV